MKLIIIKAMSVLLGLVLIASLVTNYMYYRRLKHEEQYVRLLYNQCIFYTDMAAGTLGKVNHGTADYQRAAVDTSDAANALSALEHYESIVQHPTSGQPSTPHVKQISIFLSYVSLALVKRNPQFQTSNGLVTIRPSSAKTIVFKMDDILMSNIKDSNIPTDKVSTVFDQIYNLIPKDFNYQNMLDFFYH
jgi:hypothetical protein